MKPFTSSHALFQVFADHGLDRIFLVPGESYLGLLDAVVDFPQIDVVTCRHEGGAGYMAVADGRLTRRPGVALVSRGPGASNAAIAVHTAQQDAVPMILIVGQIAARDLRREAFQEIDYQKMYGSIAKWVFECQTPEQLGETAFKAIRMATSGVPGPVVLVIPEDIQQQTVAKPAFKNHPQVFGLPEQSLMDEIGKRLADAKRPLVIAGGMFNCPGGREALKAFVHHWQLPTMVSFRRHDIFANDDPLFVGDLGLSNPAAQMATLQESDFILALGTRLGDITTQNFQFPRYAQAPQAFLHCYPDSRIVNWDTVADYPLVCDPVALVRALTQANATQPGSARQEWLKALRQHSEPYAAWPNREAKKGVNFTDVVRAVAENASRDTTVCLDAGTFAAPVYRHFNFKSGQRLMAPLAGAMGYGTPAALACAMREPERTTICMVGDGGFMMTGNEMILAVERKLPIIFIVSNNGSYGSIRLHQERGYPGRVSGTSLFNPDFYTLATSFGMKAARIQYKAEIDSVIKSALATREPLLIEVNSSLDAILP
ncbi:thiamine pyrophosphate-dependent enzyme [Zwartia panacis]|uniref:thiamine pyrophosphate-dependent enzyme n=1 Tax=Zwartia panacis TaxID=2683345 RepID=UPI0025B2A515|nr:thiamine pyrophosphate-dependent enzyme [Zwartia panacis]MDN4015758.1 thiamine pyrophosphate-binding protein [Zwartia panacis]